MNLDKLYLDLKAAMTALGLTEVEVDLKPHSDGHVKIFVSCKTVAVESKHD